MNRLRQYLVFFIYTNALFALSNFTYAACMKTDSLMTINETTSTALNFGKIQYSSNYIQPIGSIIGQIIVQPTHKALSPETTLWTCDKADLPNIYFLVATAGWDTFGGYEDFGNGIYATWFRYIGLKQTMAGVTLSRNWAKVNIKTYKIEKNKIKIRLRDIPALEATLYKVNSLPGFNPAKTNCNRSMAIAGSYSKAQIFQGGSGYCRTASALIQLSGNNKVKLPFGHDGIGDDSSKSYKFYKANNGIMFGLATSNTSLSQDDTCAIRTKNPLITIPTISAIDLNKNISSSANFSIELECNENIKSGINSSQLAMGFLPSISTQNQTKHLKLVSGNGASLFLTAENYYHTNTAKGVGLVIQNPKTQSNINFLTPSVTPGGGNSEGWYPIIENNTTTLSPSRSGYKIYRKEYRAVLKKLPNQSPTPGQFKTTATIMVKIQ